MWTLVAKNGHFLASKWQFFRTKNYTNKSCGVSNPNNFMLLIWLSYFHHNVRSLVAKNDHFKTQNWLFAKNGPVSVRIQFFTNKLYVGIKPIGFYVLNFTKLFSALNEVSSGSIWAPKWPLLGPLNLTVFIIPKIFWYLTVLSYDAPW